ncbi:MAG: hypothetical protein PHX07_04390 [Candidatus Marinimicrobia bacterium]|jgi:hypothetical protein|nr:hypothetical protein [Candidatus Neomarinimicrobiota bacterium]MDD4961454.1 hypothetical protein [Candidatus Neomarinimicrobiota bacterium]MDD5709407.1 hypothetical protein [Candidatus Neomarinimicrobiota bacterium]MDX9777285.1 hypothetical protein [bacterium]
MCQDIGNSFVVLHYSSCRYAACVLRLPSAVLPGDYNHLFNPDHPDFNKISIVSVDDFPFNERMFR